MHRFLKKAQWFALSVGLVLSGCSKPNYTEQESAFILIKAQNLKYADMGFIYKAATQTKAQIYASAQPIFTLTIYPDSICIDETQCLNRSSFNEKFLNAGYPADLLSNIFHLKPIFQNQNLIQTPKGFTQKIYNEQVTIDYIVEGSALVFKDTKNDIVIKIKQM